MKRILITHLGRRCFAALMTAALLMQPFEVQAASARIKDIVNIEGVRDNQLVGYGLVVGLNGTGDSLNNSPFTKQSLQAMLERLGVNTRGENMRTANVAAVMVTANLPAFCHAGLAPRRQRRRPRRCLEPAGRHAAGDPAARRRRRSLRHRPGLGDHQRLLGAGRRRLDRFRRPDHRPHLVGRPDRARDRLRARRTAHAAAGAAQPRSHHVAPRRARHQRLHRHALRDAGRPRHHPHHPAPQFQRQHRRPADRHRTTGGARPTCPPRSSSTRTPASSSWARTCASRRSPWRSRTSRSPSPRTPPSCSPTR